jgi:hypothetical protein
LFSSEKSTVMCVRHMQVMCVRHMKVIGVRHTLVMDARRIGDVKKNRGTRDTHVT